MKWVSGQGVAAVLGSLLWGTALSTPALATCTGDEIDVQRPTLAVDVTNSTDCGAHAFSWNAFLALMGPSEASPDKALYQTYMPVSSLFVGNDEKPAIWGEQPAYQQLGKMFKEAGVELELIDTAGQRVLFGIAANEVAYNYLLENTLYNQQCFLNHDIRFPFGSVESGPGSILLKTSWRVYDLGQCPSSMVCQDIYLEESDTVGDPHKSAGLLGMHIVQKTPTHQEWMWASFEHVANAPDCSPGHSNPISGDRDWHLFKKTDADQTNCHPDASGAPSCNSTAGGPVNICRVSAIPAGGLDNCKIEQPNNEQAIACLNASVQQRLPAESALQNYRLIGSLRMEPGMTEGAQGGYQTGSLALANTSMESFLQGPDELFNCFGCHAQSSGDFSHVFFRIKQLEPTPACPLVK
tara:strand:+ start:69269 stop:70498 length:1230 start_codon:yes stop_codon:yes gene_type:complete